MYQKKKNRIVAFLRTQIETSGFEGAVIGISGGIDSAVVAALLVEALGKDRVFGLLLPERDFCEIHSPRFSPCLRKSWHCLPNQESYASS